MKSTVLLDRTELVDAFSIHYDGQRYTITNTSHTNTLHFAIRRHRLDLPDEAPSWEPLRPLWPQAGSAADRRPERTKWGRQPRSRRQLGQGADEFFAACRSRRRLAAKKLVGGEAPPPDPVRGRARCFCCAIRRRPSTARSRGPQGRVPKTPCPPAQRSPQGRPEAAGGAPSHPQGDAGVRHEVRT